MCARAQADTPGADHGRGISIDVDEAELLNDVEMGGMSHGELVAHIRTVQQELLSKVRGDAQWRCAFALASHTPKLLDRQHLPIRTLCCFRL